MTTVRYGNTSSVPLSLAVFLATDDYDYNADPMTISATTLLKPLRQIILPARIPPTDSVVDLESQLANRMGAAIHSSIENAWKNNHRNAMALLGFPSKAIDRVLVNPKPEELFDGCIPIYLEQRATKQVGKWKVSGKFDFVGDGRVEDFKSTSTYTAVHSTNEEKYSWQGSIYRWLNPAIITRDEIAIQWIFTDWSKAKAMQDPKYPQKRNQQHIVPLKSINETDSFVRRKLALIEQYWGVKESAIPDCSDEDLWRSDPVFKYYKSGAVTARSTKNFATRQEATLRFIEEGNVGLIKEVPGEVKACRYCDAFAICSQKDRLILAGDLTL